MKKDVIINRFLGTTVTVLMVTLFYLAQKNYNLLDKSNLAVIVTNNLITGHQNVSNDFKNAIIYISTYKNSPSQDYVHTYGRGLWELKFHVLRLKRLVSSEEKIQLDTLSKQIDIEENWLTNSDPNDVGLYDDRDKHIKSVITIQRFFDNKISQLVNQSIENIKTANYYLLRLYYWITALIIFTSVIILLSLMLINKQLDRVKLKNSKLKEIAWIQSHKVRAQVANLLGLGQLLDQDEPDNYNNVVMEKVVVTTLKLDEIVHEIINKTSLN